MSGETECYEVMLQCEHCGCVDSTGVAHVTPVCSRGCGHPMTPLIIMTLSDAHHVTRTTDIAKQVARVQRVLLNADCTSPELDELLDKFEHDKRAMYPTVHNGETLELKHPQVNNEEIEPSPTKFIGVDWSVEEKQRRECIDRLLADLFGISNETADLDDEVRMQLRKRDVPASVFTALAILTMRASKTMPEHAEAVAAEAIMGWLRHRGMKISTTGTELKEHATVIDLATTVVAALLSATRGTGYDGS